MSGRVTKRHVLTAIAVFCGVGAALFCFTGDIGIMVMILLPLCGFFAYLGMQWKGLIIAVAAGFLNSLAGFLMYAQAETPLEWGGKTLEAIGESWLFIGMGLMGALAAFLFQRGFSKDPSAPARRKWLRVTMVAAAVVMVAFAVGFVMIFTGDPVLYVKGKLAADEYVAQTYPDDDYRFKSCDYDFVFGEYGFYYEDKAGHSEAFCMSMTVGNAFWPMSWFRSYELTDGLKEQKIGRMEDALEGSVKPEVERFLLEQFGYKPGEQYSNICVHLKHVPDDADLDAAYPENEWPGDVVVWFDSYMDESATFETVQALARDIPQWKCRVDAFDICFNDEKNVFHSYENVPVGKMVSAGSFDELADYRSLDI